VGPVRNLFVKKDFVEWLGKRPYRRFVPRSCVDCPLAVYLRERHDVYASVIGAPGSYRAFYTVDHQPHVRRLPRWAARLVEAVDSLESVVDPGTKPRVYVTAREVAGLLSRRKT
jgi:hypothetical protein